LSFSTEYAKAIEFKQVSQQEAERSKYIVLKAEQERRAAVIRAEGESESARLISQATKATGQALVELRRIEAAKEIAATLSKGKNIMYVPNGNNMLMALPSMTQ
jgi:prohibitin 1